MYSRELIDRRALRKRVWLARLSKVGGVQVDCLPPSMSRNFKKFVLPLEGGSVVVGRIKEIVVSIASKCKMGVPGSSLSRVCIQGISHCVYVSLIYRWEKKMKLNGLL